MNTLTLRTFAVSLALGAAAFLVIVPGGARAESAAVDPAATQTLRRMTDYVGSLQQFSVHTQSTVEVVLDSGEKIQFDSSSDVKVRRPDRLRAERTGDLVSQVVVYDGKTLAIHNPGDGYYAFVDAPPTIDEMLHFARDSLDLVPPVGDLVYQNSFELLTATATSGMVVGKSVIDGVRCDHLAFRNPVVDWQVWIADGDTPLPYKYVITTRDDPERPQYAVVMSDWNVTPKLDDGLFQFAPPADARRTEFLLTTPAN
jgi:hypothetical protein